MEELIEKLQIIAEPGQSMDYFWEPGSAELTVFDQRAEAFHWIIMRAPELVAALKARAHKGETE